MEEELRQELACINQNLNTIIQNQLLIWNEIQKLKEEPKKDGAQSTES